MNASLEFCHVPETEMCDLTLFVFRSLSNLHLTELDKELMQKLVNLESLDLSQNQLTEIAADIKLNKLKKLNVSHNQLPNLDFLNQFPTLQEVFIDGNKHDVSRLYR